MGSAWNGTNLSRVAIRTGCWTLCAFLQGRLSLLPLRHLAHTSPKGAADYSPRVSRAYARRPWVWQHTTGKQIQRSRHTLRPPAASAISSAAWTARRQLQNARSPRATYRTAARFSGTENAPCSATRQPAHPARRGPHTPYAMPASSDFQIPPRQRPLTPPPHFPSRTPCHGIPPTLSSAKSRMARQASSSSRKSSTGFLRGTKKANPGSLRLASWTPS